MKPPQMRTIDIDDMTVQLESKDGYVLARVFDPNGQKIITITSQGTLGHDFAGNSFADEHARYAKQAAFDYLQGSMT